MRDTKRRRQSQGGQEILEFALVSLFLVPLLIGAFSTGMSLVRSLQAGQATRDMVNIYIHGGDFSTYGMQQIGQRVTGGLNLQIGSSFNGNVRQNTGNGGDGLVTVSQIMYIGPTTSPTCAAVGAVNCVNHDSFVFTQRVTFGNGSLGTASNSALGNPSTSNISASGALLSPATDSGAKLPGTGQSNMVALWQVNSGGRTPLTDGQVVYVVETYFQPPGGTLTGTGVYARYFF